MLHRFPSRLTTQRPTSLAHVHSYYYTHIAHRRNFSHSTSWVLANSCPAQWTVHAVCSVCSLTAFLQKKFHRIYHVILFIRENLDLFSCKCSVSLLISYTRSAMFIDQTLLFCKHLAAKVQSVSWQSHTNPARRDVYWNMKHCAAYEATGVGAFSFSVRE